MCCGAIVSNYQRSRVENVCQRLGLRVLAYLWQRNRTSLLQEIIESEVDAVLIKTSGAGLMPHKHLGRSLRQLLPTLLHLQGIYGLDVCGEGGEYETLVLDCPLFPRYRLSLDEVEVHQEGGDVGWLLIHQCTVQHKYSSNLQDDYPLLIVESTRCSSVSPPLHAPWRVTICEEQRPSLALASDGMGSTGVLYPPVGSCLESQFRYLMTALESALATMQSALCDICLMRVFLRSGEFFERMNAMYDLCFGRNPPSRCCVVLPLPMSVDIAVEAVFFRQSHADTLLPTLMPFVSADQRMRVLQHKREVLHVRSVSEWAPLCIGPYSQANVLNETLVFVAGKYSHSISRI